MDSALLTLEQPGMTNRLLESGTSSPLPPETGAQMLMSEPSSLSVDQMATELAIQTIRYEAEDLDLSNYIAESREASSGGQHISLRNTGNRSGEATGVFEEEAGKYNVSVGYYDESDGISNAIVTVDGNSQSFLHLTVTYLVIHLHQRR